MWRTKTALAWLCGRRLRAARFLAASQVRWSSRRVYLPRSMSIGRLGTRWRSCTAFATTSAIRMEPLISAARADSRAVAVIPGYSSATVDSRTSVSPREGSTCSM